ncbi:MAG: hypothetical protein GXP62_15195, partial [Oligoflexia bacterium]|nr:hypothetical protein [Oligoflexia bacterium]
MRGVGPVTVGLCGLLGLVLGGCVGSTASDGAGGTDCGTQTLAPGQVRACRIHDGEVPDGVGARQTDWRIQNALLDVIVRGDYASLTRLSGAGGTVVAATPTGGTDPVMELVPSLPGGWFMSVKIR